MCSNVATHQIKCFKRILVDFHARLTTAHVEIHMANHVAIRVALRSAATKRRKPIYIKHHFLYYHLANELISFYRIASTDNSADLFTRQICRLRLKVLFPLLYLIPQSPQSSTTPSCSTKRDHQISQTLTPIVIE